MKIGIIVNCASYEDNIKYFEEEFLTDIHPKLEDIGYGEIRAIFPYSEWLHAEIRSDSNMSSQDKAYLLKKIKENNKGFIVRQGIKKFREENKDSIIHIDGSKKFKLNSLVDVAVPLLDSSVDVVLTVRNISGISIFREVIEDFEKFILEKKFCKKILDGQSGCWGINLKRFEKITENLTSIGYEIELEILIESLRSNLNIVWLPIKIINTGESKSKYPSNIQKIKFICQKINLTKSELNEYLEGFEEIYKEKIKKANEEQECRVAQFKRSFRYASP